MNNSNRMSNSKVIKRFNNKNSKNNINNKI